MLICIVIVRCFITKEENIDVDKNDDGDDD